MNFNPPAMPLNILLADDDMDDRFFFSKALDEIPINTKLNTVNNGDLLMEYLTSHQNDLPDVLFLDLSMPRKTGFECLAEIKENKKLAHIAVIMFTTSFTRSMDLEDNLKTTLIRMGAADYIRKPGDFETYKLIIHETLSRLLEKKKIAETEIKL